MATSNENFGNIQLGVSTRSKFNMSNNVVTSANFGQLIPLFVQECYPSDVINLDSKTFIQQASALACPTFGQVKGSIKSFFVPYRIIYDKWMQFITGGSDGTLSLAPPSITAQELGRIWSRECRSSSDKRYVDTTTSTEPIYSALTREECMTYGLLPRGGFSALATNIGLSNLYLASENSFTKAVNNKTYGEVKPSTGTGTDKYFDDNFDGMVINTLPFRAYQRIWWDYYRDSRMIDDALEDTYLIKGTSETQNIYTVNSDNSLTWNPVPSSWNATVRQFMTRYACFDKDYFTTASVNPQVGSSPSRVTSFLSSSSASDVTSLYCARVSGDTAIPTGLEGFGAYKINGDDTSVLGIYHGGVPTYTDFKKAHPEALKYVWLPTSNFTVEEIRQADALQRYLETKNIAGGRYIQQLFAQFGIKAPAERLDMAEFVDGHSFDINFDTITSTNSVSQSSANVGLGVKGATMSGFTQAPTEYHCDEHGIFMTILDIMPVTNYSCGIDDMFTTRTTKEDYFQPEFENTGFQAITNKELFIPTSPGSDNGWQDKNRGNDVFGYTPRYANLKWKRSVVAGDFMRYSTNGSGTLDAYNSNRIFNYQPDLNLAFLTCGNDYSFESTFGYDKSYNRLFKVTSDYTDHFLINVYNDCTMTRPMDALSAPNGLVDDYNSKGLSIPFGGIRCN